MAMPFSTLFWTSIICLICITNLNKNGALAQIDFNQNTLNDIKNLLRTKCAAINGDELGNRTVVDIESNFLVLAECINKLVNYTVIEKEIADASPAGELDTVFNKYCNKRNNALECFEAFNNHLLPCLDKEEQESLDMLKRIIQSLLNFVCYKDGDQIALFIAEEGPECLEKEKDNIMQCVSSVFQTTDFNADSIDTNKLQAVPKFVVGKKQCDDLKSLETCVVHRLEQCPEITPANLVESMFNFIKNESLCRPFQGTSASKQSAESGTMSLNIGFIHFILILLAIKTMLTLD